MKIVSDPNANSKADETVLKTFSKPKKAATTVNYNSRVDDDEDVSFLNRDEGSSRPMGAREQKASQNKTLLGNTGPGSNGKIDFSVNPEAVDFILQKHEEYRNPDTDEGYVLTADRCFRQFNKMFSLKNSNCSMNASEIVAGLQTYNVPGAAKDTAKAKAATSAAAKDGLVATPSAPTEPEVTYFQLAETKKFNIHSEPNTFLPVNGEKFEICKMLNCKHICLAPKLKGTIGTNNEIYLACGNVEAGQIKPDCPQETPLNPKEQMMVEMFKSQFNGDELKAKKFLYMTKTMYK